VDISSRALVYNESVNTVFSHKRGGLASAFLVCVLVFELLAPAWEQLHAQVWVSDQPNTAQNTVTAGKTAASLVVQGKQLVQDTIQTANSYLDKLKEWVGDPLVTFVAKTTLRAITQSVVNWINNDFQGSPSFITNPEGFLTGVADKVIGRTIQAIDPLWCEPFRFNLRLAFGVGYGFNTKEEVTCRLSDVIANVQGAYDSFVSGTSNFQNGGWQNWINITGNQQNNAYGAYLTTVSKLDASIITASGKEVKLLDLGQGFKSWRKCLKYNYELADYPVGAPRECVQYGPIETPGSLIQNQLSEAMGRDLEELGVADEINEIVGALANKMIQKVMSGGLKGASNYVDASYAQGSSSYQGECLPSTDPLSAFYRGGVNYDARFDPTSREYSEALALSRQTRCDIRSSQVNLTLNVPNLLGNDTASEAARDELTALANGRDIKTESGVFNDANTQGKQDANKEAQNITPTLGGGGIGGGAGLVFDPDVSSSGYGGKAKTTRQSSVAEHLANGRNDGMEYYGPDRGIDGDSQGIPGANARYVETASEDFPWWEIDLGQEYVIKNVNIWRRADTGIDIGKYLADTFIFVTNTPYAGVERDPNTRNPKPLDTSPAVKIPLPASGENELRPLPVTINKTGRYLRIQRSISNVLSFAEVKILQSAEQNERKGTRSLQNLAMDFTANATGEPRGTSQSSPEDNARYFSRFGSDGNRAGSNIGANSSLVLVNNNAYPWWYVDLGSEKQVGQVKLWRRTDGISPQFASLPADKNAGEFLSDVYVFVSDTNELCEQPQRDAPACWERGVKVEVPVQPEVRPITVNLNEKGRFVRLQRNALNYDLSFSEVEIYEQDASPPPRPSAPLIRITPESIRYRPNAANPDTATVLLQDGLPPSYVIRNTSGADMRVQLIVKVDHGAPFGGLINSFQVKVYDADAVPRTAFPGIPETNCARPAPNRAFACDFTNNQTATDGPTFVPLGFLLPKDRAAEVVYNINARPLYSCSYYSVDCYVYSLVHPRLSHSIETDIKQNNTTGPSLGKQVIKFD
jgi:hypothetical protein